MERRELLVRMGGLLLVLPASRVLMACGSDSGGGDTLTYTSTSDLDHTHTVGVLRTDLSAPPVAGVAKTTSNVENHTHTVALTEAELASIQAGTNVTKETSNDDNHTHFFTFFKM